MKITKNYTDKIIFTNPNKKNYDKKPITSFGQDISLPLQSANPLINNTDLPIAYSKIGEITVPGSAEKASVFKLANGQRIIIFPKKGPVVIKTTYNVGSLNETDDIRGISHFIEHNLFNGSKNLKPKEYDEKVSMLGADTNASTNFAQTDYYIKLQLTNNNSLDDAIKLNALQTQYPTFDTQQLEKEKEPVKSEIDVYKDIPNDITTCNVLKNLFNIKTNSKNFILGTKDNINSFTREKVSEYFNTYYTPDNAVTVITGDVDVNETIKLVSKYYNKKNDYSLINKRHSEPINYIDKTVREDIISPNSSSGNISMGFVIPENTSKEDLHKLNALISILSAPNSNFSKALDKFGISGNIFTLEKMQNKPDSAQALLLNINCSENDIEEILKIIYEQISLIINNPPSDRELNNLKNNTINNINSCSEESVNINSILTSMAVNNDYNYFYDAINITNNLTPYDISNTAKKFFNLDKTAICISHAKDTNPVSIGSNYNKIHNQAVSFGSLNTSSNLILDEINKCKKYKLANNIETLITNGNSNAKSALNIDLKSNELISYSAPELMILETILNRGSSYTDNDTYNNFKSENNIDISYKLDEKGLKISGSFQDNNLQNVLKLIKETIMSPNFSPAEFERAKNLVKDFIINLDESPLDKLYPELYKGVKSFASKEENLKLIDNITFQDIYNLYSKLMQTSCCTATLTAPTQDKPYINDILNNELSLGLPVFKPVDKTVNNIYQENTSEKILTTPKENKQANICRAYKYKKTDNTDDIAKITLLKLILGGGMSSRLFFDLREKQKLAYSVGCFEESEFDTSCLILYINTTTEPDELNEGSPENVNKAIKGFDDNVNRLKTQNVSQAELDRAKNKLKNILLDSMETNSLKNNAFNDTDKTPLGILHSYKLYEAIDKITPEDIKAAANFVFKNPPVTSIIASKKTLDYINS